MPIVWMIVGLAVLLAGADLLVRGGSRLAQFFRVPPLVIGLTVVAFGTSSPELAVSLGAGRQGIVDLAAGNVVGSNIFNIAVILGLSAAVAPLAASLQVIRWEVPIMIGVSLLPSIAARDGILSRAEALAFVAGGIAYVVWQIRRARADDPTALLSASEPPDRGDFRGRSLAAAAVVGGLALLVLGSRLFVDGATALARSLGVSELVIGLTVVAAGTSLPELAASATAAFRGERDLAIGNVLGSNIFNVLFVLGLSGTVSPTNTVIPEALRFFDLPAMILLSVLCLPLFFTDLSVSRREGAGLLMAYAGYTALQILAALSSPHLSTARAVMGVAAVAAVGMVLFAAFKQRRAFR